jgi:hypothetical protein
MARANQNKQKKRVLDARPDTLDFRDKMYEATLVEVPVRVDLNNYLACKVPILDQGQEGACTGFGLATVAHYLLRRRRVVPDRTTLSPRMLYEMAKKYDEWPGEKYEGSSARGAMKGWYKHGVCAEKLWPYQTKSADQRLTNERARDGSIRPLGAYFRVNHKDLVAMHSAISEVGILYATATVHAGWDNVGANGLIKMDRQVLGGHAFAIVAYDERGLWIQNSWGKTWGKGGFGLLSYDDWLANGSDVWVARLGVAVQLQTPEATATSRSAAGRAEALAFHDLRPHVISLGNDGKLRTEGTYGTSAADVDEIVKKDFPRLTKNWPKKRILLYAHGGLVDEGSSVQRVADYRAALLDAQVYPLAFVWKTDFWTTVTNILKDALSRRRPEGLLDGAKDFMLDRLDDLLEPLARVLSGKSAWDEMKENALYATVSDDGGGRFALEQLAAVVKNDPSVEIHVAGHSAGSIFHAPLIQLLASSGKIASGPLKGKNGLGLKVASCTLWAPACTIDLFKQTYLPLVTKGMIERFGLFTLTDEAEKDDHCANIYHKSLLYLVSNAFEKEARIPLIRDGEPILGMEKFIRADAALSNLFKSPSAHWILTPNSGPENSKDASRASCHGDFDDDKYTLRATLARILERPQVKANFMIHSSASSLRDTRESLQ